MRVAPRAGAWIETTPMAVFCARWLVAPRAGAWIPKKNGDDRQVRAVEEGKLDQMRLQDKAEIEVEDGALVLRPVKTLVW